MNVSPASSTIVTIMPLVLTLLGAFSVSAMMATQEMELIAQVSPSEIDEHH